MACPERCRAHRWRHGGRGVPGGSTQKHTRCGCNKRRDQPPSEHVHTHADTCGSKDKLGGAGEGCARVGAPGREHKPPPCCRTQSLCHVLPTHCSPHTWMWHRHRPAVKHDVPCPACTQLYIHSAACPHLYSHSAACPHLYSHSAAAQRRSPGERSARCSCTAASAARPVLSLPPSPSADPGAPAAGGCASFKGA